MSIEALKKAIDVAGGQTALARAISRPKRPVRQGHIGKWLNSPNPDEMPPAEYCPDIESETAKKGDRVTCEELRPDVAWSVLREAQAA